MGHRERQLAAVRSSYRASCHMAAPSLGHYASLSFVVIGGVRKSKVREQRAEKSELYAELLRINYN
jgi:hypothetical protein